MEQRSFNDLRKDLEKQIENIPLGYEPWQKQGPKPKSKWNIFDYCNELGQKLKSDILEGKSGLLPNERGEIDIKQAYNLNNNEPVSGLAQLMLLHRMGELGVQDSGAFVTDTIVNKAVEKGVDTGISGVQKPIEIPFELKDGGGLVVNNWYHISQIKNPENLKAFLFEEMSKDAERISAYNKEHHPDWSPKFDRSKKQMDRPNDKVMNLNANSAVQYIGQVFAASQSQIRLRVTPEQVQLFKENIATELSRLHTNGKADVLAVQKLANTSISVCNDIKRKLYLKNHPEVFQNKPKDSPRRQREEPSMGR